LTNPPEADKFLRLPCEMRSLFLWGQTQILILEILNVFLWLKFSPSLNLNPDYIFNTDLMGQAKMSIFQRSYYVAKNVTRSHLKNRILVQDQGGSEIQPAGILKYSEELKRRPNTETCLPMADWAKKHF
jgi:hypothetical protein